MKPGEEISRDLPTRLIVPIELLTRLQLQPATAIIYATIIAMHQHNKACIVTGERLALHLHLSPPAVSRHLAKLEGKQLVERVDNYTQFKEMLLVPTIPSFLTKERKQS